MSFYADARESHYNTSARWEFVGVAVCEDEPEMKDVARMLRRRFRGDGVQVLTKVAGVKAHGAAFDVFVVVARRRLDHAGTRE